MTATAAPTPGAAGTAAPPSGRPPAARIRRRPGGRTVLGLPLVNVVLVEVALAVALVVLAVDPGLRWVAAGVVGAATLLALLRHRGRWWTSSAALTARYLARPRVRTTAPVAAARSTAPAVPAGVAAEPADAAPAAGSAGDPRVAALRLLVPDLVVAAATDHDREPVGLAWHDGTWTAVLQVEPAAAPITAVGAAPGLPLGALADCLEDRGVVLDAITVLSHCYPGSAALPSASPALRAYLEVLGPLPVAARRTTWVAVRLDPRACPAAVRERGGGVVGAHRALLGALARVRAGLAARDVPVRALDPDQLLRAAVSAAELAAVAGGEEPVRLRERWTGVTVGGVGHAGYAITRWPTRGDLHALTGVRALSSTLALSVSPGGEPGEVGLRGLVRVSARDPGELEAADGRLRAVSGPLGVALTPLRGQQVAALAATLPLGARA